MITAEAVRLVIWDMDGVFWNGVLSEGGIGYVAAHHAMVVELAQRGIMSSICSKNDFAAVKLRLEAEGIWPYFIFPSIDWTSKGQRIAALIENVQLRAGTVLFIDDLAANLAEARYHVPDLSVAGPDFLKQMLDNPRLAGRPDERLSRLAHYKTLEAKKADAGTSNFDNHAFLIESKIEVTIGYDVDANIDRAVELINRANQLNFTKARLPEDIVAARASLRRTINEFDIFSGFVMVKDRYGDYGDAGLFVVEGRGSNARLIHFCFSCRILSMGVERWIYRWLGRPGLRISGEVACDVMDDAQIDWITLTGAARATNLELPERIIDRLVLRGGCDMDAMSHYLRNLADDFYVELNTARHDRQFRIDTSMFLNWIFDEVPLPVQDALISIGYVPSDWTSALSLPVAAASKTVWIFSFWTDGYVNLYKHNKLDLAMPFLLEGDPGALENVMFLSDEKVADRFQHDVNRRAYQALKNNFIGFGAAFGHVVHQAMDKLLAAASGKAVVIVILAPESWRDISSGKTGMRPDEIRFNELVRGELTGKKDVYLVDFGDFVPAGTAYASMCHYDRQVYMRAATHVAGLIRSHFTSV